MGASAISRALAIAGGFAVNAFLARHLPVADFAYLGVLVALATIAVLVLQFGYQTSIVRVAGEAYHSGDTGELTHNLVAGSLTILAVSVVFAPLFVFGANIFLPTTSSGPADTGLLLLSLAFIAGLALNNFYGEALRGLGHVASAASLTGMGHHGGIARVMFILIAAGLVTIVFELDLQTFLIVAIGSSIAVAGWSVALLARDCRHPVSANAAWSAFRVKSGHNATVLAGQLMQTLAGFNIASLMAGAFLPVQQVAFYVAADQVMILLNAPKNLLESSAPKLMIVAHRDGDSATLEKVMRAGASAALVVCFAASVVLVLGGAAIFGLLFGSGFEGAWPYLAVFLPGILFHAASGTAARALLLLGFEKQFLRYSIVCSVLTIPIYALAARYFEGVGLAATVSLMLVLHNIGFLVMVKRLIGVKGYAYVRPAAYLKIVRDAVSLIRSRAMRS